MIIFLFGPDTYRSREKLKELKQKFLKEIDPSGINLTTIREEDVSLERIKQAVGAQSFFAKKRMVVIENACFQNKRLSQEISDYVYSKAFPKDVVVVFFQDEKEKTGRISGWASKAMRKKLERDPLFEKLQKEKYAQQFQSLPINKLNKWLQKELKKRSITMSLRAQKLLIAFVGNDLWQLSNELNKLCAYKNGKEITGEDVEKIVVAKFDDNIFNLVDAVSIKSKKKAVQILTEQLQGGTNALYILAMLIRQFRILVQVKLLLKKERMNSYQLGVKLNLHPYVAQKAYSMERNFSLDELRKIYNNLLETEVVIKSGDMHPELALDLLVTRIVK